MFENNVIFAARTLRKKNKRVAVIGAGRIGSWTAFALCEKGIRNLTLIDFDRVTEDNIRDGKSVPYNFFDLDDYKVNVLRKRIIAKYPDANIKKYRARITPRMSQHRLFEMLDDSLLIVWAIDSREGLKVLENEAILSSKLAVIPAMHARSGGGHVVIWAPFMTPCPKHSLGLDSFDDIIETRAQNANISTRDIKIVVKHTVNVVEYLLFWRISNLWKGIDLEKSNYLHIEKNIIGIYRKEWLPKVSNPNCFLCNFNLL